LLAAACVVALLLSLMFLGVGMGWSVVSPWALHAKAMGLTSLLWIGFMQLAACALGGYLAGRLGVKGSGPDNEEVHVRDRSNAKLAWVVASLVTVLLLAGGSRAMPGEVGAAVAAVVAAPVASAANKAGGYFVEAGWLREQGAQEDATGPAQPHSGLWVLVALALGAVTANLAATFGGLQRDGMRVSLREP